LSNGKCRDFIVSVKVAWCVWVKLNVLQKRWLVCRLAALLILRSVGILSSVFSTVVDGLHGRHSLAGNGLQAGEVCGIWELIYFERVHRKFCLLAVIGRYLY